VLAILKNDINYSLIWNILLCCLMVKHIWD
jgi:hypothetical protein